ncbi:MAG: hypothetical protein ACI9O4_001766 [Chitinophagales bacterium]|jgi:hypothetical protein
MAIGLPAYHEERRKHGSTKERCEEQVRQTLSRLPWIEIAYLKEAFDYRTGGTILTHAERIIVYVGNTEILVKSACLNPAQFLDFGKNKKNVVEFFKKYDNLEV